MAPSQRRILRIPKRQKKRKIKKKKTAQIDDVFADMENVFNGLSWLVLYFEPQDRTNRLKCLLCNLPILLFVYIMVSTFSIVVMLPCCFVLLVVRTAKVETKLETGFAIRQQVLKNETTKQKSLRMLSLLFRSVPMVLFIVVYPLLACYVIIPAYNYSKLVVMLSIGSELVVILLLQILGSVRGIVSYIEANKKQMEEREKEKKKNNKTKEEKMEVMKHHQVEDLIDMSYLPREVWTWRSFSNIAGIGALCLEGIQLATFPFQLSTVKSPFMKKLSSLVYFDLKLLMPLSMTLPLHKVYAWGSFSAVFLLLTTFCVQLIRELRGFQVLKLNGRQKDANNYFFYSFVGAIVYGHGEMKDVTIYISAFVSFLSDVLFMVVASKLLILFSCEYPIGKPPVLMINQNIRCWDGEHAALSSLSLICFGYYLPLSAMVAPIFTQSKSQLQKQPSNNAQIGSPRVTTSLGKIIYVQPFLSIVTISKCAMIIFGFFFGLGRPSAMVMSSLILNATMLIVMLLWISKSHSSLFGAHIYPLHGLSPPVFPSGITIMRTMVFVAGIYGAILALLYSLGEGTSVFTAKPIPAFMWWNQSRSIDVQFIFLCVGGLLLLFYGILWYCRAQSRSSCYRQQLQDLRLILKSEKDIYSTSIFNSYQTTHRVSAMYSFSTQDNLSTFIQRINMSMTNARVKPRPSSYSKP